MLTSFVRLAWRHLAKSPGYTLLNVGGLALGIAAAFVLGLYVRQELTSDRAVPDAERVYRIATDFYQMGGFANSQEQLLDVLPTETTVIEATTRLSGSQRSTPFLVGDTRFEEPDVVWADTAFFQVFAFPFVAGSAEAALRAPDGLVLTEQAAARFFGDASAMGQTVLVGKEQVPHRVTGVVAPPPGPTHLGAALWLPLVREETPAGWTNVAYYNYVKLRPDAAQADLERGLDRILRNHAYPASDFEGSFGAWAAAPLAVQFFVQPLHDIYLHSDFNFELRPGGNPAQVYALGIVGLFILLIAGVNYVNLTTARSTVRAREVGVKKTMGATQGSLVRQFIAETVVFSLVAAAVAVVLAEGMLAAFAFVTGTPLMDSVLADGQYALALLGFSLAVGVLAGLYPAFYLARFRPAVILKGGLSGGGNHRLRGALVVGQFAIAIVLVVGSLVVYQQLTFMQRVDKGLAPDGVVFVENMGVLGDRGEAFRRSLDALPHVEETSLAGRVPTGSGVMMYTYQTPTMEEALTLQTFRGDEHYLSALGMRLVAGRPFSSDLASDSSALILNEAAVAVLGLGADPIGQVVNEDEVVVGVVSDFHFRSLRERIEPTVVQYAPGGSQLIVRFGGADTADFLDRMQTLWQGFAPDEPLRTRFLDDNFAALAAQERMLGRAVSFFTLLALAIAAMGLFGLVAFAVQQRTKEIGIRKVLGASVSSILALLSKDFLRFVGVAFVVAVPLAYLVVSRWLDGFAYRIDLGLGVFVAAGLAALAIALVAVSAQALRAASADPVESLRYE
ncbi:MAG: ABC transporter permease [Rhodothermales bacterium]